MLYGFYEEYLKDYEYEIGTVRGAMTYEGWKEYFEVDETMSLEELCEIFWY